MTEFTLSFGDAITGLWCADCTLPSAVSYEFSVMTEKGCSPPVTITGCPDCGTPILTDSDGP